VPLPFEKVGRILLVPSRTSKAAICLIDAAAIPPDPAPRNTAEASRLRVSTSRSVGLLGVHRVSGPLSPLLAR
jgi:hypothetical protein